MAELAVAFWLAVVAIPGFLGAMLIARHLPGLRAVGAFVLWLPVPFVLLAIVLAADGDPAPPSSQASYTYQLAVVLFSFAIAVPWVVANLAGGVVGLQKRRRSLAPEAVQAAPFSAPVAAPVDAGFPDWSRADNPSLSLADISELMRGIAARAGIEERWLPEIGPTADDWGNFIDRDKFDYIYFELERGGVVFDLRTVVADQLMYWVFRDRAYAEASNWLAHNPTTPDRYNRPLADKQQEILAGIDPRWAVQFAYERRHKTGR